MQRRTQTWRSGNLLSATEENSRAALLDSSGDWWRETLVLRMIIDDREANDPTDSTVPVWLMTSSAGCTASRRPGRKREQSACEHDEQAFSCSSSRFSSVGWPLEDRVAEASAHRSVWSRTGVPCGVGTGLGPWNDAICSSAGQVATGGATSRQHPATSCRACGRRRWRPIRAVRGGCHLDEIETMMRRPSAPRARRYEASWNDSPPGTGFPCSGTAGSSHRCRTTRRPASADRRRCADLRAHVDPAKRSRASSASQYVRMPRPRRAPGRALPRRHHGRHLNEPRDVREARTTLSMIEACDHSNPRRPGADRRARRSADPRPGSGRRARRWRRTRA